MTDREKVIRNLEELLVFSRYNDSVGWNPYNDTETLEDAIALLKKQEQKCRECGEATSKAIQELQTKLKAQEAPTDVSISSAIECLLHPQDADDSDMAKAIDTAVRAMRLLKEQEPVSVQKKQMEMVGLQTWDWACGNCGQTVLFSAKYCPWCGRAVKWG